MNNEAILRSSYISSAELLASEMFSSFVCKFIRASSGSCDLKSGNWEDFHWICFQLQ